MTSDASEKRQIPKPQRVLNSGIACFMEGNREEARRLLIQSLKLDESNAEAWLWLRACLTVKSEQKFCLRKALNRSKKTTVESYLNRAIFAIRDNDFARAKAIIARGLKSDPQDERAWLWLTVCLDSEETVMRCLRQAFNIREASHSYKTITRQDKVLSHDSSKKEDSQPQMTQSGTSQTTADSKPPVSPLQQVLHLMSKPWAIAAVVAIIILGLSSATLLSRALSNSPTHDRDRIIQTQNYPLYFNGNALEYLPSRRDMPSDFEYLPDLDEYLESPNGTEASAGYATTRNHRSQIVSFTVSVFDQEEQAIEQIRRDEAAEGRPQDADVDLKSTPLHPQIQGVDRVIGFRVSVPSTSEHLAFDVITFRIKNLLMQVNVVTSWEEANLDRSLSFVEIALKNLTQ
jgi:tetratricopeptide (TPR) repeat protein